MIFHHITHEPPFTPNHQGAISQVKILHNHHFYCWKIQADFNPFDTIGPSGSSLNFGPRRIPGYIFGPKLRFQKDASIE